jgi:mRNA-degrading endonuclease HigB of HigAB toxin-antitoxin module
MQYDRALVSFFAQWIFVEATLTHNEYDLTNLNSYRFTQGL